MGRRGQRILLQVKSMRELRPILWTSVAVLVVAAVLAWGWFRLHPFTECEVRESIVTDDNPPYRVLAITRLCDGIAGSDDVSIVLLFDDGTRIPVLQYGAAHSFVRDAKEATPIIEWESEKTLSISIQKVAYVTSWVNRAGDLTIETHIGSVIVGKWP